jgi:hypothetical protein
MIKLLYCLIILYKTEERIFLSWDSASLHASKALYKVVDEINATNSEAAIAEISEPYAGIMAALSIAALRPPHGTHLRGSGISDTLLGRYGFTPLSTAAPYRFFYRGYIAKGKPRAASGFYRSTDRRCRTFDRSRYGSVLIPLYDLLRMRSASRSREPAQSPYAIAP